MATETKIEVFTASTETEARARLERWKNGHPSAVVTSERKPVIGTILEPVKSHSAEQPRKIVSIVIAYEEQIDRQARAHERMPKDDPLSLLP